MAERARTASLGVFCFLFLTAVVVSMFSPAYADIYIHVDSEGVIHLTNAPTSRDYKLYISEQPGGTVLGYQTRNFDPIIEAASKKHGIDFPLLKALIKAESNFDPYAISRTGAMGLMQIMPATVEALRIEDPFDPAENVMGGARYFKRLLVAFDNRVHLALAAYNAGPEAVKQYKRIPPYKETEAFVRRVMTYYDALKKG